MGEGGGDAPAAAQAIGELLRGHRGRARMTQEGLAEKAGVSVRTIGNLEGGRTMKPRHSSVRLLADALGVTGQARAELESAFDRTRGDDAGSTGGPASAAKARPPVSVTPAQLPQDVASFTGRRDELARLDTALAAADGRPVTLVCAVSGTAGVGKTALAVHWAHRVAGRFGDGQLYVNLRGFDSAGSMMSPAEAVREFLDALGVPPERIPVSVQAQTGLYRSMLAGRQVLVVLDNARDAEQVRPLLP